MRILSITAQKPNSTGSGVYLTELVRGFEQLGYEQAVVAGICREDRVIFPDGVTFYPVWFQSEELPFPIVGMSDEMPYVSTRYSQMSEEMIKAFQAAFLNRIRQAVEEFCPDVLLCHHLYLLTAMVREAFPDRKVVAVCHGTGLRQMKKHGLKRQYIRDQIQKLDVIFSLHQAQKQEIGKEYGADQAKIKVIGSGFNDSIFRELPVDRAEKTKTILIFAGKLSEKKGVISLIKCLSRLGQKKDQLELRLAGGYGNQAEYIRIQKLAEECKYPVKFLGKLDQETLAEEFNRSDIFVLPSFYEGLPLVVMEALACGLSVVCSDIPGVRSWISSRIGECPVEYVALPSIQNGDEPVAEELPEFERRLAGAISREIDWKQNGKRVDRPDLSRISWIGICRGIIEEVRRCMGNR